MESGVSSTKIHHAPGGASSFSLGNYEEKKVEKIAQKPSSYNPLYGDSVDPKVAGKVGPAPVKVDHLKMEVEQVHHSSPKKELS